ncbi:hypothetical protein SPOG_05691 [Schizosaccharomyces cryophilus OY26]|uniref:Uncharacterized protein n=1 Tax=Schizosaccharomyces cryophilus (strain OY26 / ATCC MYA-4695 / CBS 11777 / NBRC 106824 / NRRL Y48691) TaxID=653667 RepID=S9XHC9_SCHCR|nr:uncharacterized protein SPOG_05691 [Schizosaccharomyces cryophilus OY26]EPY53081.1 hypothetical protein SPOG_05691 [Schizosaccharomyces cryophilus OY26]
MEQDQLVVKEYSHKFCLSNGIHMYSYNPLISSTVYSFDHATVLTSSFDDFQDIMLLRLTF